MSEQPQPFALFLMTLAHECFERCIVWTPREIEVEFDPLSQSFLCFVSGEFVQVWIE